MKRAIAVMTAVMMFVAGYSLGNLGKTVHAQSSYSNSDVSGVYGIQAFSTTSTTTGTLNANGSGSITGSFTDNGQGGTCVGTISGTYNVSSNGTGSITTTNTITGGTNPNCSGGTATFQLFASLSGDIFVFSGVNGAGPTFGAAIK